jgi:hypothetical protein
MPSSLFDAVFFVIFGPCFLKMKPTQNTETDQANEDQIDGDNKAQQSRHNQDQNTRNQRNDRGDVSAGNTHLDLQSNLHKPDRIKPANQRDFILQTRRTPAGLS